MTVYAIILKRVPGWDRDRKMAEARVSAQDRAMVTARGEATVKVRVKGTDRAPTSSTPIRMASVTTTLRGLVNSWQKNINNGRLSQRDSLSFSNVIPCMLIDFFPIYTNFDFRLLTFDFQPSDPDP
jgi:hypothetical protein